MSNRRHQTAVGIQIRDRAFYDTQHDDAEDKSHVDEMERDAMSYLQGIRYRDQENPAIKEDTNLYK